MFGLGMTELIVIGIILLILFGNENLPQTIRKLTKGLGEVKKVTSEAQRSWGQVRDDMTQAVRELEFQEELKKITEDVNDLKENIKEGIEDEIEGSAQDKKSQKDQKQLVDGGVHADGPTTAHGEGSLAEEGEEGHHHVYAHQEHGEQDESDHAHADDQGSDYDDGSDFDPEAYARKQEEIARKIEENKTKAKAEEAAEAENLEEEASQQLDSHMPTIKPPEGQVAARQPVTREEQQEQPSSSQEGQQEDPGSVPHETPAKSSSS